MAFLYTGNTGLSYQDKGIHKIENVLNKGFLTLQMGRWQ